MDPNNSDGISGQEQLLQERERERIKTGAEEIFRRLVEFAPDAIILVNDAGKIVFANAQTEKLFGYSRQELIGQIVEKLMPERFRSIHVQDRSEYAASPRVRPMGTGLELYGLRKDSTEFPVNIALAPLETAEGVLTVATIRDITERKRAEREVCKREERHKTAIENIFKFVPEGILVFTDKLKLFSHNKTFDDIVRTYSTKLGYTEDELKEIIIEEVRRKLKGETSPERVHSDGIIRIRKKE